MTLIFILSSAQSFPTMNHQDNDTEGRNTEFESTWPKPSLDPSNIKHKSNQPELTSTHEKELSRTPKEAALPIMTSESDQILMESDAELEEGENYPTEVIEEALKSASSIVKEFLRPPVRVASNSFGRQISKRDTPDQDEFTQRLCPVTSYKYRPRSPRRSADPGDNRLYLPVNLPEGGDGLPSAFQAVETVKCEMVGLNTASNSLAGYDTWCKQEYVDLPMVALDTTTSTLVITKFRFPHSCTCYLKP